MPNTITILAPSSTNASGTIVTTVPSTGRTDYVQFFAATNYKPGLITWSCTAPNNVSVSTPASGNPYYLAPSLKFTGTGLTGATTLTLKANDATNSVSNTVNISIVTNTITLSPANPIIAVNGTVTLTATSSAASPSITQSSWVAKTAGGTVVTAAVSFTQVTSGSWAAVTATFPSSNANFTTGAQITISVTDSTNSASAQTIVLLAPSTATDSNITLGYGANGSIYMANNAWSSGAQTNYWTLSSSGVLLPYPMQYILQEGVYAADISGASVSTVCCYILNLKTFNTLFSL